METVKETINQAANMASNAATSVTNAVYGGQTEEHRSMVDDKVTTGPQYSGRVEHAKDAMNTDKAEAAQASGRGSSQDDAKSPSGPGGSSKPQGVNVTGTDTGADTNRDPISNKDEANTGFGGGGSGSNVQPSVSAGTTSGGGAGAMGQPKLPDSESTEEGTGTKYEKSTGLKADGGDFDASRPGAGREADRLLEEMGIKHGAGGGTAGTKAHGSVSDPTPDPPKQGLVEKIKDKIHH
jgi:hypothetical protein